MPRATFFRCKSAIDEDGIVLYTPMKWKRDGWLVKWRQVLGSCCWAVTMMRDAGNARGVLC